MANGKVKWCSERIGAGFIRSDEGEDVFFRFSALRSNDLTMLQKGQYVSFDILKKSNGLSPCAANVKVSELSS